MSELRTVTMELDETDFQNAEKLKEKFHAQNKATAVSLALGITAYLSNFLHGNEELIIRDERGDRFKVLIPGLTIKMEYKESK